MSEPRIVSQRSQELLRTAVEPHTKCGKNTKEGGLMAFGGQHPGGPRERGWGQRRDSIRVGQDLELAARCLAWKGVGPLAVGGGAFWFSC